MNGRVRFGDVPRSDTREVQIGDAIQVTGHQPNANHYDGDGRQQHIAHRKHPHEHQRNQRHHQADPGATRERQQRPADNWNDRERAEQPELDVLLRPKPANRQRQQHNQNLREAVFLANRAGYARRSRLVSEKVLCADARLRLTHLRPAAEIVIVRAG